MKEFPLFNIELIVEELKYPRVIRDEEEHILEGIALYEARNIPRYGILTSYGNIKKESLQELDGVQARIYLDTDTMHKLFRYQSLLVDQDLEVVLEKKNTLFRIKKEEQTYQFPKVKELVSDLVLTYEMEVIPYEVKKYFNKTEVYRLLSKEELKEKQQIKKYGNKL